VARGTKIVPTHSYSAIHYSFPFTLGSLVLSVLLFTEDTTTESRLLLTSSLPRLPFQLQEQAGVRLRAFAYLAVTMEGVSAFDCLM